MENIKPKVAIIIVNYKSSNNLSNLLRLLFGVKTKYYLPKIVIVNNDSQDKLIYLLSSKYPQIHLIDNKRNLGFAKAVNRGIRWSLKQNFSYILLLNPDLIMKDDFILPLLQLIKFDKKIGIVSPILEGKEGNRKILALGSKFNKLIGRTEHFHIDVKARPLHPINQEMVSGCAMLIKRDVLNKIGLFDERFFFYFEDNDYCLRARQAGFKIYIQPKSLIVHLGAQSLGGLSFTKIKYLLLGNVIFDLKWVKPWFWPLCFGYLVVLGSKMIIDCCSFKYKKFIA